MIRVGIYCRVSTDQQVNEGDSIQAQLSALRKYAEDHNYEIAGEFIDDGVSGTLFNERDELQRLLEEVKKRNVDLIIFTKLDRYFRNLKHYLNTQEVLDKFGVPWIAIWEHYETQSPQGKLMVSQMLAFAQFEAEQTGQRINQVFNYKKTKHEALSGCVPIGYKIKGKHIIPDPETADIAKQTFQTYLETGSIRKTMRLMQGNGLPKTQGGFKHMLMNRKYIGEAYGIEGYFEPIIDKQTFETVQHMLRMNVKANQVRNYVFSGMIWCSDCGGRMTSRSGPTGNGRYKSYRCMYHYRPIPTCSNTKSISEKKLEKYLVENLKDLAFADINVEDANKAKDYEKQIAATEKKMSRLKELYVNELINLDEYKRDMAAYKADIDDFKARMKKYEGSDKTALKDLVGTNLDEWYWTLTDVEKRELWGSVIDKIYYGSDKQIKVIFR